MRSPRFFWLLGVLWVASLAGGWFALLRHQLTPGSPGRVPERWPADSALRLDGERPTLVLFAHRNCPCTRTTLGELEHILTHASRRVSVRVVLLAPSDALSDRVGGDIEARARALPGAEVVVDSDGAEARRFHVRISGHVVLYGADGRLRFGGGITDGRGHAGESEGRRAVLAWLQEGIAERCTAPVYGCSLFTDEEDAAEEQTWNR